MNRPLFVRTPVHLVQLCDQGEGGVEAAALRSRGCGSPRVPYERLLGNGRRHEGGTSSSRDIKLPSGPLAGGPEREEATVQQLGSPPLRLHEAYGLLRDAARAGLGVIPAEPYACIIFSLTFGREKKLQAHMRLAHRDGSASPSSSEEVSTRKRARKPKPKPATVKMEPRDNEPPLPFPMVWGATSLRGQSPIHAAGEELPDSDRSLVADIRRNVTGMAQVGVNGMNQPVVAEMSRGREDLVSLSTLQVGHVLRAHIDQAIVSPAENPEVNVSEPIVIEDDSSDDDNANPIIAVIGFGVVASSAPDAAAILPMARAPAAATTIIVIPDDNSDDDNAIPINAVTGIGAVANLGPDAAAVQPMPRAPAAAAVAAVAPAPGPHATASVTTEPALTTAAMTIPPAPAPAAAVTIATARPAASVGVAVPIAADMVKGNGFHEAGARYRNGGSGKAVAGYSNVGYGKAAAGYSSGGYGYGYGKAIAIGGQSKRGLGNPYSCADCGETFYSPQALGGHANGHKHKEKKSRAMLDLQIASARRSGWHVCTVCDKVFLTGQALGWHRRVHFAGLISAASDASSSSAPRPAAAVEPSEAIVMNSNAVPVHGPANPMHRGSFPASARSAILELPALNPVHEPPRGMAMAGNPVFGLVSAATAATGSSSLPATTSSVLPAIPLQNQEENPPKEIAVVHGYRRGHTIRIFGFDTFPAFSLQNQEEDPLEEVAVALGNVEHRSIPLFGFNTSPPFPSQNQKGNPPEAIVPGNRGPEEVAVAPDNRGPRAVRLFGVNIAEGPEEPKK